MQGMALMDKETKEVSFKRSSPTGRVQPRRHDARRAATEAGDGRSHTITAGNASQLADGSSACVDGSKLRRSAGSSRSAVVGMAVAGTGPMKWASARCSRSRTARTLQLKMDDIGLWELNEAFAVQVLYCRDKLGIRTGYSTSTAARSRSVTVRHDRRALRRPR